MSDELIGKVIGGYEIISRIGEGGMATVYLARQQSMNRQVAVKVLPRHYLNDDTYLQRFEREVAIVSKLEHRSIVPVHDYGEFEGQPYIVMRYMSGGSLDGLIRQGALAPDAIYNIVQQLAPALDYAHSKDVLHRDLKPSNVLLDDNGGAFITDFGIARVLNDQNPGITTQGVVGTPSYMSPEQAQAKDLDGRSDLYSLGVMIFEMATGRRPFESETAYSVAVMQVTAPPPLPRTLNPDISTAFEAVILKMLRKNRQDRYPTATALMEALKLAIDRPTSTHDTEPRLPRPELLQYEIQQSAQPIISPPQPMYQVPPSSASRPAIQPPSGVRPIRQKPAQSPFMSAVIGGSIGCGLLGIIVALAFLALNFFLPPADIVLPTATSAEVASTDSMTPIEGLTTEVISDATATPTLDATSETARQTLVARSTNSSGNFATITPLPEAQGTVTVLPVGLRGTPEIPSALLSSGDTIVYADVRGETRSVEIVTLNLDTWADRQLTQDERYNSSYPIASPNGGWIAFQSDRDGDLDIYIMNRGGGEIQRLTFNDVTDRLAAWSPDGNWIIYSSDSRNDERYDLRRVSLDSTTDELVLSNNQRNSHARYSPDGRYIVFTTGADPRNGLTWEIALLDTETQAVTYLTNNDVRDGSPVFSPDGQSILYITFNPATESNAIAVMNADGSNSRILYDTSGNEWAAAYSPDGQRIIMTSNITGDDQLYLLTIDGQTVQQITTTGGLYGSWLPPQP